MPFFKSAWGALRRGTTNMDVPISIGVTLATGLSLYETVTHGADAWFDGALMLLLFLLAGRALDAHDARPRARRGRCPAAPGGSGRDGDCAGRLAWIGSPRRILSPA
jgi:cation transport ATPase